MWWELLGPRTALTVTWAQPGRLLRPGVVYVAPPDQHLLVSIARSLRLSQRPHVQFVRPSADDLVESVAASYRERAIAVVLTGSRSNGAPGAAALFDRPTRVPALLPA
jgi:two-component system, chemotaxis family, protein-glutamate methylesterase/glutaminase